MKITSLHWGFFLVLMIGAIVAGNLLFEKIAESTSPTDV